MSRSAVSMVQGEGLAGQLAADEAQQLSALEACHVRSGKVMCFFRCSCQGSHPYSPSLLQVQAVLQNAIDKLALMSVILVDPTMQAQQLTRSVGEEISRMITQQKQLEQRFQELIAAQPALRAMANKANLHNNQTELQEVSAALKQATKQLCRNLRDNPNVSENMAKVAAQREALQMLFSNTIDSLLLQGTVQPVIEAVLAAEQAEVWGLPVIAWQSLTKAAWARPLLLQHVLEQSIHPKTRMAHLTHN